MDDSPLDRTRILERELVRCRRELADAERYRKALDSAPAGFGLAELLLDDQGHPRDFRLLEANEAFGHLTGFPPAEARGKTARELVPALEPRWIETLARVAHTGEPTRFENEVKALAKWFELFADRIAPMQIAFLLTDITERKRAEDALRESEERYRALVENLYEGIWLIDAEAVTTFVNARMAELLGYQVFEMIGRHLSEFMSEPAAPLAVANLARGREGLKAEYEFEFRRKDGSAMLTRIATTPLFDQNGGYRGALAAVMDVTESKRTEAALKKYAEGQDFLVGTALRLLQPLERQEIFDYVAERIHLLVGDGVVLFSEFDPARRQTILRTLAGTEEQHARARGTFGRDPLGVTFDFPESIREQMLPGELAYLPGGLCELAFYQIPRELCDSLERALSIRRVYAMACSVEQDLLGTVAVLILGDELPNKRLIETIVSEAALALKRRRVEEALRDERNFFDTVFDIQGAIVAILDPHFRIVRLNRAYYANSGFPDGAMTGRTFPALMDADSTNAVEQALEALATQGAAGEFESRMRIHDGGMRHISWRATLRRNASGEVDYVIATGIDVTERMRMEEHTRHLAEHDALTDLPNRRLLLELVEAALLTARRSERKVAVLFLDLDRFKVINDTLGHDAGDALLKDVAARLTSRGRRSDIVARLGGDEFAVLLGDLPRGEQAGEVAREIVRLFHQPFPLEDQNLHITASLGISLFPDDSDTPEGLLRRADLAMYEAKEEGRNTYRFYNPVVDRRARERARIESSLRQALERDELRVVYQPEIELLTGRIIGVEALLRWHHPELGVLDPIRFIPIAEETELITLLDDWVLRHACLQAQRWIDQALQPLCLAVNVSARRFESPDLVEAINRHLTESGLSPEHLELELTEHTVMHRIEQSADRMRELVALGVSIAIDDFGTGYSSLSYLKQLPIRKLKIDQSFVRDIATDADDRAIIKAVTTLAHTLNKRVIAEGVETETQRQFLETNGCDEAQGYLFSRPLPPDQLAALIPH